jgi:hypothetical protein
VAAAGRPDALHRGGPCHGEARVRLDAARLGFVRIGARLGLVRVRGFEGLLRTPGPWAVTVRLGSFGCGTARFVSTRRGTGFVGSGTIEPRGAHDATPALTIALCSPPDAYGKADDAAAGGL